MQALSERLDALLSGKVLRRADLLGFSSLKTYAPAPGDLTGAVLEAVTRRAKYLVWHFDDGNRIVLHLFQAGRLDIETPPKKTKPRGAVARFVFGEGTAGLDGEGIGILIREYGTQRKALLVGARARRRRPPGRSGSRARQRRVRRVHPDQPPRNAT